MKKFNVKISEVKRGTELQYLNLVQLSLYKNIEKQTLVIVIVPADDDDYQHVYLDDIEPRNIHYALSLFKEAMYKNIVIQLYDKQSGELFDFATIDNDNNIVLCKLDSNSEQNKYYGVISQQEETAVLNYIKQLLEQ